MLYLKLMEGEKTSDHKSKFNALESALNAVVKQGCTTRLGVRAAPTLTDLKRHDSNNCGTIEEHSPTRNERPIINDSRTTHENSSRHETQRRHQTSRNHRNKRKMRVPDHVQNPSKFTKFRNAINVYCEFTKAATALYLNDYRIIPKNSMTCRMLMC